MFELATLKQLYLWALEKPIGTTVGYAQRANYCPIAQYYLEQGYTRAVIGQSLKLECNKSGNYEINTDIHPYGPVISKVDDTYEYHTPITREDFIYILSALIPS